MKSKLLSEMAGRREWVLVFDPQDGVLKTLETVAENEQLTAAHFTGIGAVANVTVGWFDLQKQTYVPIDIDEQVEVISLIGDVAEAKGKPAIHAHICVAGRDGIAHGGHLRGGRVMPTLELILIESPANLQKTFRPEFGIALFDPDRSDRASLARA